MSMLVNKFCFKILLAGFVVTLLLAGCGGGGGGNTGGGGATATTATLKIVLTGNLPASTAISGASFTLTLPANVTPATVNGTVVTGVVSNSGTFSNSTIAPLVIYTPATTVPGALNVTLTHSAPAGITQVGEVATIILQLANNATPTSASFGLSAENVIEAVSFNIVPGMGAGIASVTLQ